MLLVLSRIISRSNCILILIMSNLAISAPVRLRKRSPIEASERGFSISPRILEIQLPLKITSKEDLLAWSKYVLRLMTPKANFTSKNAPLDKRVLADNSAFRLKEMMKKTSLGQKGLNYPARRLKEPRRGDEKVVAYPLPMGGMKAEVSDPQDPYSLSTSGINGPIDFGQYANYNFENLFQQNDFDFIGNPDILLQPPAATYLPLPLPNVAAYGNTIDRNTSGFVEPAKLQTTTNPLNFHISNNLGQILPSAVNDGLFDGNLSLGQPLLTFPFQAVITITGQHPIAATDSKSRPKDHFAIRNKNRSNEFLPFFEKNSTLTNESGQVDVFLNGFTAATSGNKVEKEREKEGSGQKKKSEKKTKSAKKQKASKRQSSVLGDLLRMLGILRKLPKNSTDVSVATPILSILRGTNAQKIQVAFEDDVAPNRGRRNETSQAQQLNGDDDDDDDENEREKEDEEEQKKENQEDDDDDNENENQEDDDDEEEGGSIQAVIDLLPLAAPILEELSDPDAEVNIVEVIQGAIPLLQELSDPNEEGGVDIPAVLLPLSQKFSQGADTGDSDSGAIFGPIIQLIAPLIGPLSGPLIGPLSRISSGPAGKEGSGSIISAAAGPLSEPQGPHGQSVLSRLVASITAKLSKELAAQAGDSDIKSLVSAIVSGVIAGASAGSSGNKGQKDTYYAPTTYGGYDSYGSYQPPTQAPEPNFLEMLKAPLKEVLSAFLKLSATSSTSSANLSGASSSTSTGLSASSSGSSSDSSEGQQPPQQPAYGAPTNPPYSPPPAPGSTGSPYATFARRQVRIKKF